MSRFDFLKDKFQPLYEKCTQAEQATDISVKMLKIRQTLEYLVRELGEDGNDLFNNIGSLSDRDILNEDMSRLFQRTRMITNRGIHENQAGSLTNSDVQIAVDNLAEITIWYAAQYKKQSCHLNDFAPEDVSIAKRYLNIHADAHSEAMRQMIQATVNVDPLAVMGNFDEDDDAPADPLEKDVFETDKEYAERIAQMEPIHIGYGILDMRKGDGYTNVRFLQHHLDKNKRVRFTQSPVYFFVNYTEQDEVIDGELVAKLRVYNSEVYCDYSCIFLRSDEVDIPVQVICWDKFGYESEEDCQKRIEVLPILPLAQCKPIRNQYNLEQQILPFAVRKYAYVHIPMGGMYDIPCSRDLAKQITAQKQIFTMFGKILNTGEVTDFMLWNRESRVLYGTANALGVKRDREEQQANYADVKKALEQLKYKREERERQLREQREREKAQIAEYLNRARSAIDKTEAVKWYQKAAEQGNVEAQYELGYCYYCGNGVDMNEEEAVKWYRKAAEQGNAEAQYELGDCYYCGDGVDMNEEEAVKWYRKAAEQGNAEAQSKLGDCYYCGDGVDANKKEAVKWYRKAAEQGDAEAQYWLGYCYYVGVGVYGNKEEAVKWYRKAAEQGDAEAQYLLGYCYYVGVGVYENKEEAVNWYRKAAEQGLEKAKEKLKLLSR